MKRSGSHSPDGEPDTKKAKIEPDEEAEDGISIAPPFVVIPEILAMLVSYFDLLDFEEFGSVIALGTVNKHLREWVLPLITHRPGWFVDFDGVFNLLTGLQSLQVILSPDTKDVLTRLKLPKLREIDCIFERNGGHGLPLPFIVNHASTVTIVRLRQTAASRVDDMTITDSTTFLEHFDRFSRLTTLQFDVPPYRYSKDGPTMSKLKLCPTVRELILRCNMNHSSFTISSFCNDIALMPRLEKLMIQGAPSAEHGILNLALLTNLTSLSISNKTQILFNRHPVLSLTALRELRLADNISPEISCLTNLEVLNLPSTHYVEAPTFDAIFRLPKLRKLAIVACPSWSQVEAAPALEKLFLYTPERTMRPHFTASAQRELAAEIRAHRPDLICTVEKRHNVTQRVRTQVAEAQRKGIREWKDIGDF
jgi:hypothetical protein